MNQWQKLALKLAKRSPFKKHRVGAVLIKDTWATSPCGSGWSHVAQWNYGLHSIHAEIAALHKVYPRGIAKIAYIACLTEAGNRGLARPCLSCATALAAAGVELAIYTTRNTETWGWLRLNDPLTFTGLKEYKRATKSTRRSR